ncbi:hypothetical protein [Nannocystis punicea]|uniref:Uncharacterized protein n=1 Tax=Nannocystis punicea TaxID=2995304 RepID=A0ABY7HD28_9BACT|nr:hypothetical protein [Nannocystis poenicansa]WAS97191.1 hypothetical protein O0S08_13670 [Nannocystis poenicansa]
MRNPFPGHRRYSITHRAVQRLRELVPTLGEDDDEALRDRLDHAITNAEDSGKAVRTLDVMLAEPQILIPLESFGDVLYAIIKEDTVVTVLPRGHGEEILQRGQALEQRVAAGEPAPRPGERDDAWERRRWRRDAPAPVIERVRASSPGERTDEAVAAAPTEEVVAPGAAPEAAEPAAAAEPEIITRPTRAPDAAARRVVGGQRIIAGAAAQPPERKRPTNPIAEALARGLALGKRRAATRALGEALREQPADASLLPLWNLLGEKGLPEALTVGDLVAAVRGLPG